MNTTVIYALVDPRKPECARYIGKTVAPIEERLQNHIAEAKRERRNHRHCWILSLLKEGVRPHIVPLEYVPSCEDWALREKAWITVATDFGYALTNSTLGGEGAPGNSPSAETRLKMSAAHKGKPTGPWTEEWKRNLSAALRGRKLGPQSAKHRAKLAAAHIGVKRPPRDIVWQGRMNAAIRAARWVRKWALLRWVHTGQADGVL